MQTRHRIWPSVWASIVLLLLSAAAAQAQPAGDPRYDPRYEPGAARDEGQFRILQARYGTAQRNVDVTERLKEIAGADRQFRMGNDTFGIDPDPGRVKTLRIYARGPRGANQVFEFREGSVIDGAQFRGWGRGEWGERGWRGGWNPRGYNRDANPGDSGRDANRGDAAYANLNIARAVYGDGVRSRDVTGRLRDLARDGRLDIVVNNDSMGTDPSPGSRKSLTVVYSDGRRGQQQVRVGEDERLSLP